MIPASISATALHVAELCPARFHAEHIEKSKGLGTSAANTGSAVHGALEIFVQRCYIDKLEEPSLKLLQEFYALSYAQIFGSFDNSTVEYADGFDLINKWYKNQDLSSIYQIISVEVKDHFDVPTSAGIIPFNYIWDRFDQVSPGVFRVVDYKTNRWNITRDQLQRKIQARAYGLAAAIQLKAQGIDYKKIWVEFNMLRHDPIEVGVVFTREDNKAFWNFLINTMESILATPDTDIPEKLNPECLFCVRKASCGALKKNIVVGGINSIGSLEDAIDLHAQLDWQQKGISALMKEVDARITTEAKTRDIEEAETDVNKLTFTVRRTRKTDSDRVELVIGQRLFEKYGSKGITIKNIETLLKGNELTPQQKSELRSLIYFDVGDPSIKVEPRNPIDED